MEKAIQPQKLGPPQGSLGRGGEAVPLSDHEKKSGSDGQPAEKKTPSFSTGTRLPVSPFWEALQIKALEVTPPEAPGETTREYLSDLLLRAEHKVLTAIGVPSARPYLTLIEKHVNALENQFLFRSLPAEARQALEKSSAQMKDSDRAELQKLLRGEPANLQKLPDAVFPILTSTFKLRLKAGETLEEILPEAFAVAREAARRTTFMRPFDVQVMGGVTLSHGGIAEMMTGEGKTLAAVLPAYLHALEEKGSHVITVNDYLAKRDAAWMGPAYRLLGMKVGVVTNELSPEQKREAYQADITYVTNQEIIFDYLRDNLVYDKKERVQRGLHYGIVDEVDLVLTDEARTPFIISEPVQENQNYYVQFARLVDSMKGYEAVEEDKQQQQVSPEVEKEFDYIVYPKSKRVVATSRGLKMVEAAMGIQDLYSIQNMPLVHFLDNALQAQGIYKNGIHYLINDKKEVQLVDEFTGRILDDRRYSDGLHQAIEAKEGVPIQSESRTIATMTVQNFFKMYNTLSGMTGTALTEAQEFMKIYGLPVVVIPPNRPCVRVDHPDVIYKTKEEKWRGVTSHIAGRFLKGQPVLVGTRSIEDSEDLSRRLTPPLLQESALVSILLHKLQEYAKNEETEALREYLLQSLTREDSKISMEMLGKIAKEMQVDSRIFTEKNLDLVMSLWQIPDLPPFSPERDLGESERQLRHQNTRDRLSTLLKNGIPHQVLNAKYHAKEARIVSQAGRRGAVTIATNMAGRGTDIRLGGDPAMEFQEPLASAVTEAALSHLKATSPLLSQTIERFLKNPEAVPFPQVELELRKKASQQTGGRSLNDQVWISSFQRELSQFLQERPEHPLSLVSLLIPEQPSLDCTELLKVVVHGVREGSAWARMKEDSIVQQALAKTLGPLRDSPSVEAVLSRLPVAVTQAAKEQEEVKNLGGLEVLGTERHEARRIDNQLRGRSGRQGDPGESQFYLSLEDEVPRLFGSEKLKRMFDRLGIPNGEGVGHSLISKAIDNCQEKVEKEHFYTREKLMKYDEVINKQREVIYTERNTILDMSDLREELTGYMADLVADRVERMDQPVEQDPEFEEVKSRILLTLTEVGEEMRQKIPPGHSHAQAVYRLNKVGGMLEECFRGSPGDMRDISDRLSLVQKTLGADSPDTALLAQQVEALAQRAESLREAQNNRDLQLGMLAATLLPFISWPDVSKKKLALLSKEELKKLLTDRILEAYHSIEAAVEGKQPGGMREIEKRLCLYTLDEQWVEQLSSLENIKDGIEFEGSVGKDPVVMFNKYAYEAFQGMLTRIKEQTAARLLQLKPPPPMTQAEPPPAPSASCGTSPDHGTAT